MSALRELRVTPPANSSGASGGAHFSNTRDALNRHVDKEDRDGVVIHDSIGRQQKAVIINESGLYALILSSQLEQARAFQHWVTAEDTLRYLRQQTTMTLMLTVKLEFIKGLMADPL